MKKRNIILIPIIVLAVVAVILMFLNRRQTPAWEAKLNQYLDFLRNTDQVNYQIVSIAPAASPANFSADMSAESFGDSVIFQTTHNLITDYSTGLQPMPYPPEEVICVLLKLDGQQQLVYIALHNSLYNADWIIHISPEPWGSPTLQSHLRSLGCALGT